MKTILVRHEQTAAIMADAYARATGKPAVVMAQGLFIGSNAAFGIMESMLSSSPMLVLTDTSDGGSAQHPANQSGAGEYGSIDLQSMFKAMTKYTTLATSPKEFFPNKPGMNQISSPPREPENNPTPAGDNSIVTNHCTLTVLPPFCILARDEYIWPQRKFRHILGFEVGRHHAIVSGLWRLPKPGQLEVVMKDL